jgi:oligopeptide transport system substrate-binding protein
MQETSLLSSLENSFFEEAFLTKKRKESYIKKLCDIRLNFIKKLSKIHTFQRRPFLQKFIKVHWDFPNTSKALGICFAFTFLNEEEKFSYKHIAKMLKRLLPGIRVIEDSCYLYRFAEEKNIFCYVEIEKIRGKHLSLTETMHLKENLAKEVEETIELVYSSLFMPTNEEEIYKNIATLSKEVGLLSNLPHVMISFIRQGSNILHFNVVIVRLVKGNKPLFQDIISILPLNLRMYINKISVVKRNCIKEICVFSVEVFSNQFYRKNYSIDFLKARKYISLILEKHIGEFRDYNGGILLKQCELLDEIEKKLANKIANFSLIEELVLSLVPSNIQLVISADIALNMYHLFLKLQKQSLNILYDLDYIQSKSSLIVFIKTKDEKVESFLYNIALEEAALIGYTKKIVDNLTYFCFVQINPSDLTLLFQIQTGLKKLKKTHTKIRKDTLRIPFQESLPPIIHPHLATDTNSFTICKALYEGITRVNLDGVVELGIAEKIEISPCKKIYTISLKNTRWSNGEPLEARHFVDAWKKAIYPNTKCLRAYLFFLIKNAEKIHRNSLPMDALGVKIFNNYEILIELEHPAPYFTQLLAEPLYSPLYDCNDPDPNVSNGPFKLGFQEKNEKISLLKNVLYWDSLKVKLEKIDLLLIKKFSKSIEMFYQGKIDWIGSPFGDLSDEGKKYFPAFQIEKSLAPFWLYCNTKIPQLKPIKIRKALSLIIDRVAIGRKVIPHQVFLDRIIPDPLSLLKSSDYLEISDINLIKQMFSEGLKEANLIRENFSLTLSYSRNTNFQESLVLFLKKTWESNFNIKVILKKQEWDDHWNNLFNGEYEIAGACKFPIYSDITYFLKAFLSSPANFTKWENKKFLEYIELAENEISSDKRKLYLLKAEKILQDEMPIIPLYNRTHIYLCNPKLKNLLPPRLAYTDFKWAYFN